MCANDQWLYENMPRLSYSAGGVKRTSGIKIAAGHAVLQPNKSHAGSTPVYFGGFFSQGCRPVVLATCNNHKQGRLFIWTSGIGDRSNANYYPDDRGFTINVQSEKGVIGSSYAVAWIAVGY
jgi:hypothetical protein